MGSYHPSLLSRSSSSTTDSIPQHLHAAQYFLIQHPTNREYHTVLLSVQCVYIINTLEENVRGFLIFLKESLIFQKMDH